MTGPDALTTVGSYREFVDHSKAAAAQLVRGLRGTRPPTPILSMVTQGNVTLTGIDPAFFAPDHSERRVELIDRFVVPLVREREASMIGWTFAGLGGRRDGADLLTVVTMDREVHETWIAPLVELAAGTLAPWELLPPNQQAGRLITPVQEALR